MRVIVSIADQSITVDGVALRMPEAIVAHAAGIDVIRWDGADLHGTTERNGNADVFRDPAVIAPYLELWQRQLMQLSHDAANALMKEAGAYIQHVADEKQRMAEFEAAEAKRQADLAAAKAVTEKDMLDKINAAVEAALAAKAQSDQSADLSRKGEA